MKIVRESATELVFRQGRDPMAVLMILFSLFIGGVPLLCLPLVILEGGIITVECLRSDEVTLSYANEVVPVNCTVEASSLLGLSRQPPQIVDQVIRANLVTEQIPADNSDCSTVTSHSLVLTTYSGKQVQMRDEINGMIYIGCVSGNASLLSHYATRVNQFIASNQQAIRFSRDTRFTFSKLVGVVVLSIFVVMGGVPFRDGTRIETLIFDKRNGTIIRKERELLILLKESKYQFSDVKTVEVRDTQYMEGDKVYEAFVAMQSGLIIGFGYSGNEAQVRAVADTLRRTLSRP